MRRPGDVIFVSYPSATSRVGEMDGQTSLRESVRWRKGVDGVIIYFISHVAQDVREGPVVGQERSFRLASVRPELRLCPLGRGY
jgi:hypothetical protein